MFAVDIAITRPLASGAKETSSCCVEGSFVSVVVDLSSEGREAVPL